MISRSLYAFLLVSSPLMGAYAQFSFGGAIEGEETIYPDCIVVGDLDGDTDVDLVVGGSGRLSWFENMGSGTFAPQRAIADLTCSFGKLRLVDVDGDGDGDIVALCMFDDPRVVWYENLGAQAFGAEQEIHNSLGTQTDIEVGDLDQDGLHDLAFTTLDEAPVRWCRNLGGGQFDIAIDIEPVGPVGKALAVGDVDSDGTLDLCVGLANELVWYSGSGTGTFSPQQPVSTLVSGCTSTTLADVDQDGDLDLFSTSGTDGKIAYYEGLGPGFGPQSVIDIISAPVQVLPFDLNGDGALDLLSPDGPGGQVSYYLNLGSGSWTSAQALVSGVAGVNDIGMGDLDQDGNADVAMTITPAHKVAWYPLVNGSVGLQVQLTPVIDVYNAINPLDLDDDGDVDVLSCSYFSDRVQLHVNDAGWGFGFPQTIALGVDQPMSVTAADLDGDGDKDVVVALNAANSRVAIVENLGAGIWALPQPIGTYSTVGASHVFIADLNSDGWPDVIAGAEATEQVWWFPNDGAGGFPSKHFLSVTAGVDDMTLQDIDLDGDLDIGVAQRFPGEVFWLENDGTTTFWPVHQLPGAVEPHTLRFGDVDGDGDMDLVTGSIAPGLVWHENTGGMNFDPTPAAILSTSSNNHALELSDVDLDGDPDVACGTLGPLRLFLNDGTGGFQPPQTYGAGLTNDVAFMDMDGDGVLDLVLSLRNPDGINWYKSSAQPLTVHDPLMPGGSFRVFPSPAADVLHVLLDGSTLESARILDNSGRSLQAFVPRSATSATINITHLSTGCYLLQGITSDGHVLVSRFFVE